MNSGSRALPPSTSELIDDESHMVFKIEDPASSERKLTQSVIQVTQLLGMYHAELARILGKQCADVGDLSAAKTVIATGTSSWHNAELFVAMYNQLFDCFDGDSVAMYHWMRAPNKSLGGTPHFLIVDDGKLQIVHDYLLQINTERQS